MRVFLVRHAHAGARRAGGDDFSRPLSERGCRQAFELADEYAGSDITAVLSSPATRCVQTVEPLAARLGLDVVEQPDLWEGSETAHVLALLSQQRAGAVIACSHGDVIPAVIDAIAQDGVLVKGRGCEKGSVWSLEHEAGAWVSATYLSGAAHT